MIDKKVIIGLTMFSFIFKFIRASHTLLTYETNPLLVKLSIVIILGCALLIWYGRKIGYAKNAMFLFSGAAILVPSMKQNVVISFLLFTFLFIIVIRPVLKAMIKVKTFKN